MTFAVIFEEKTLCKRYKDSMRKSMFAVPAPSYYLWEGYKVAIVLNPKRCIANVRAK